MRLVYLYVLLLEQGKYYVGMAEDIGLRLWEHFKMPRTTGAAWTRTYPPVSVIHCSELIGTMHDFKRIERQATLRLAKLKGFENVRGAGFSLTTTHYPKTWDEKLLDIPPADMNAMTPLAKNDLNRLMKGKYHLWLQRRREAIKKKTPNDDYEKQAHTE